ncbi:MAG: endoribonuclease MazF [Desulfarculaceae bacterium]|jgi:mRNA interferase MazF
MYIPDAGDLIWLSFDPQAGHEQAGRRPALVLSPSRYNKKSGLLLACPITNQAKGYPFEVEIPAGLAVQGVVLVDQIKSLDWRARKATKNDNAPHDVMAEVLAKIAALLSL